MVAAMQAKCAHCGHAAPCGLVPCWHPAAPDLASAPTRADILDTAKEYVTRDRAATHGDAEDTFASIASLWSAYLGEEIGVTDVSLMMCLLKMARLKGNPPHLDSWIDIAGYAACGGEIAGGGA